MIQEPSFNALEGQGSSRYGFAVDEFVGSDAWELESLSRGVEAGQLRDFTQESRQTLRRTAHEGQRFIRDTDRLVDNVQIGDAADSKRVDVVRELREVSEVRSKAGLGGDTIH